MHPTIPIHTMRCPEDCSASCGANLLREMFVPFGRTYGASTFSWTLDKAHFDIILIGYYLINQFLLDLRNCLVTTNSSFSLFLNWKFTKRHYNFCVLYDIKIKVWRHIICFLCKHSSALALCVVWYCVYKKYYKVSSV